MAVLRLLATLALFVVVVAVLGWTFRAELEQLGAAFVGRWGALGMMVGAFLADGLHFPLPPQFYLLTGIAGGERAWFAFVSVAAGSTAGGLTAFALARSVSASPRLARWMKGPRALVTELLVRRGSAGLWLATLLPISYWVLCTVCGLLRLPLRAYAVLAVMRIPRLLLSWIVITAVWPA